MAQKYIKSQLEALGPCYDHYSLQLSDNTGNKTNHLNITQIQLKGISDVLMGTQTPQQAALLKIQSILSGNEWGSDTASCVAEVMEEAGYLIASCEEEE